MKVKEIIYIILDRIKGTSDDFSYTEEHILFLEVNRKYQILLILVNLSYIQNMKILKLFLLIEIDLDLLVVINSLRIFSTPV